MRKVLEAIDEHSLAPLDLDEGDILEINKIM
jgi:hypothetical protein